MSDGFFYKAMVGGEPVLRCADAETMNMLRTLKPDVLITGSITVPRNPLNHRRLFALFSVIKEQSATWNTTGRCLELFKTALGVESISYASMDETDFQVFFSRCIDITLSCVDEFVGHSPEQIEAMVERVLHFSW